MSQTRCDLFGHDYKLWKEGGKSYMKCSYCPAVRHVTADDIKPIPDFDDRPYDPPSSQSDDWWWFAK